MNKQILSKFILASIDFIGIFFPFFFTLAILMAILNAIRARKH